MSISILGMNIKRIREEKGISAYKLAKEANISSATISQIESGNRQSLNSNTVEKIANVLGVGVDELFSTELNKEYIVTDIEQAMRFMLSSDELVLDDNELTEMEKEQIQSALDITFRSIRKQRELMEKLGRVNRKDD
ncbi:MAG: helix-turn-helix transcriptional regulator [Clostridium thermopalmarium]|uniref:helix-turn-helix domain-containing protein n=1 Tax=Clostridium thermopalmarium TaxID=29373 RepID=UPI0023547660|nr:helix-turn-helix transcriptional regulator [Clostridium thermopalmarium]MBE6044101.1 helix-turn-helix transcriptional regulator [Clostridium thermopalmarium]